MFFMLTIEQQEHEKRKGNISGWHDRRRVAQELLPVLFSSWHNREWLCH